MEKIEGISVFFPVFNLENYIVKTISAAAEYLPKVANKYELIAVEDGSKDNTLNVLKKIKGKYPELKIIKHTENKGYGAALKSGFYNAKHDWVAFTDGDGQFDITELGLFIEKQRATKADLVIGYYLKRQVSAFTIFTSKVWELIVFMLFGLKVRDIDCGFKLIRRSVFDNIDKLESERGAFISSELLIRSKKKGYKIEEVGVHHFQRSEDKKTSTGRSMKVIIGSFNDLFNLWKKLR